MGGLVGSKRLPADDDDDKRTQDSIIYLKHFESIGFIEHQKANAIVFDLKVSPMGSTPLPPISV